MKQALAMVVMLAASLSPATRAEDAITYSGSFQQRSKGFLVLGDTQRTLWLERLFLFREQNDAERERLIQDISAQDTDLLVMTGDLVADGSSASDWEGFDLLFAPIRSAKIPVLPALGNHDYRGLNSKALKNVSARFPQLAQSHWYSRTYGGLGLIWLDTNRDELSGEQWKAQVNWYADTLSKLELDDKIRGIFVFGHHPPFTNSTVTGDEKPVQEAFVGPFLSKRKTLAFITGHAHAYEHFKIEGKTFIVSGGGGGPRVKLLPGSSRRHEDLYSGPSPRPFHYLKIVPTAQGVRITARGLDKGATELRTLEEFSLP